MKGCSDARRKFSRPIVHVRQRYDIIHLFSFWGGVPLNGDKAEDYGEVPRSKGGRDLQEGFWRA